MGWTSTSQLTCVQEESQSSSTYHQRACILWTAHQGADPLWNPQSPALHPHWSLASPHNLPAGKADTWNQWAECDLHPQLHKEICEFSSLLLDEILKFFSSFNKNYSRGGVGGEMEYNKYFIKWSVCMVKQNSFNVSNIGFTLTGW